MIQPNPAGMEPRPFAPIEIMTESLIDIFDKKHVIEYDLRLHAQYQPSHVKADDL